MKIHAYLASCLLQVFVVIVLFIAVFAAIGIHLFTESYHNIGGAAVPDTAVNTSSNLSLPLQCKENSSQVYTGYVTYTA